MPTPVVVTSLENDAIASAKDAPTLVANLNAINSPLATQLEGSALLAAKTPLGAIAGYGVAWLVTKYGLGWDPATTQLASGLLALAGLTIGAYVTRYFAKPTGPITGIVKAAPIQSEPSGTIPPVKGA